VPVDGERHICAHVVGVVGVFAGVRVVACGLSYVNISISVHDWRHGGEIRIGRRATTRGCNLTFQSYRSGFPTRHYPNRRAGAGTRARRSKKTVTCPAAKGREA
jgi:hypothetical protein